MTFVVKQQHDGFYVVFDDGEEHGPYPVYVWAFNEGCRLQTEKEQS